ncbi:ABC transporter permease [Acidaminobacter sp. JC074]|uniref:ABC transporter permease n=1 Tax=Acidaminobacter sp. JC074 TaxID=2530199 RepID=UPI001F0CF595|nr:ABC transporter permease [Acidaminobacter sp. JC074]MCH4887004.1 ABC transporter permease [Acidaminobacter sp. JC074]
MFKFILRRLIIMIPLVLITSMVVFAVIQLPPGDYVTTYIATLQNEGETVDQKLIEDLREEYGLDQPLPVQYFKWMKNIITKGDFGYSFSYNKPVNDVIGERMATTLMISGITLIFTYAVAIPIGIYSALHQYSIGDYIATIIGFLGMATPNFLLAILLMFASFKWFGDPMMGLMSVEFIDAPMSLAKFVDILKHLIIPVIVIGTGGTCGLIRVMRGQMLDELDKQYVLTGRSKGLEEKKIRRKYIVRAALNPIASSVGWNLTKIFSGSTITAIVLNLPTQGPVMLSALRNQDMYLAGTWLLFMSVLTMVGTLISDIVLAWLDPRIRLMDSRM